MVTVEDSSARGRRCLACRRSASPPSTSSSPGATTASELAELVVARGASCARRQLVDPACASDRAWTDLVGLCDAAARVLTRGEVLRADAFEPPTALMPRHGGRRSAISRRASTAAADGADRRPRCAARSHRSERRLRCGRDVRYSRAGSSARRLSPTVEQQDALLNAIESRLAGATQGHAARAAARAVRRRPPWPRAFTPRDRGALITAGAPRSDQPARRRTAAHLAHGWTQSAGRTQGRSARRSVAPQRDRRRQRFDAAGDRAGPVEGRRSLDRDIVHQRLRPAAGGPPVSADARTRRILGGAAAWRAVDRRLDRDDSRSQRGTRPWHCVSTTPAPVPRRQSCWP